MTFNDKVIALLEFIEKLCPSVLEGSAVLTTADKLLAIGSICPKCEDAKANQPGDQTP